MVISAIMRSLPPCFKTFLDSWSMFDVESQTFQRFIEKLIAKAKAISSSEDQTAFLALRTQSFRERGFGQLGGVNLMIRHKNAAFNFGRHPSVASNNWHTQSNNVGIMRHQNTASNYWSPNNNNTGAIRQQINASGDESICHYCKKIGHWKSNCNARQIEIKVLVASPLWQSHTI